MVGGRIRSCGCLYKGQRRGVSQPNTYEINGDVVCGTDFKGNHFYFDVNDLEIIRPYTWYLNHDGYVVARIDGQNVTMHRFLLGNEATVIDHDNHHRADNRRANLRRASNSDNGCNRALSYVGKPVIGVYQRKHYGKYEAVITKNGQRHSLGFYDEYDDAGRARLNGEVKFFGDFASQKHLFEKYGIKPEELNA